MSKAGIFLRNVASNWVGFAVNAAITFVMTPIVLDHLGASKYGVWILAWSIVGYYGLLDLGLRAGVSQYLTRYFSKGDFERASECLSAGVTALGALGVGLAIVSLAMASAAPALFDLPGDLHREAFWCVILVGCTAAIGLVLAPLAAVFMAAQRFDIANAIGVTSRIATAVAVIGSLEMGYGLIGVCVATCAVSVLDNVARAVVVRRLWPQLGLSLRANGARLREMMSFGGWSFLISLNGYVVQYLPNLLIGWFMPVAAVGYYSLAASLVRQIAALLNPITTVAYPAAIELHVKEDAGRLEKLYIDGSRLVMLAMTPVVLTAFLWADDFYRLWIGEEYLTGERFHSVAVVLRVLVLSIVTSYLVSIASQILLASGRAKQLALTLICGSLLNLILSLTLLPRLGLVGAAIAVVGASVVIDMVAIPLMFRRTMKFSFAGFLAGACVRPAVAAVAQTAAMLAIRATTSVDGWLDLAVQGGLAAAVSVAIIVLVGLNEEERLRFVVRPIKGIVTRLDPRSGHAPS